MHYRLKEVPTLLRTPAGRRDLAISAYYAAMPMLAPLARVYRRTFKAQDGARWTDSHLPYIGEPRNQRIGDANTEISRVRIGIQNPKWQYRQGYRPIIAYQGA